MSRFVLTVDAKADLKELRDFIAEDDVAAAERQLMQLRQAFRRLARFPRIGHRRDDIRTSEAVLFLPVGSYVVIYRPEPKPLTIVRVVHGRRDLAALLF